MFLQSQVRRPMLIGEQVSIPADRKLPRRLPKHRFTEPQIIELRTRRAAGESLPSLAKASNTIPEYVSYIATGKIHERVGGPITEPYQIFANARMIKFGGEELSETKWAERVGLPLAAVKTRLHRGWSEQKALTTPLRTPPSEITIPPSPSIAYVALNEGQFACVDVDTIPLVQDKNWYVVKDPKSGRMYPATHTFTSSLLKKLLGLERSKTHRTRMAQKRSAAIT